ncbi:MAG TPA: hypothetical protein EYO83_07775 [Gemmatimonadetes bacterium]|nr:hypothetical protein [Gemmatimonadota bacterium]
MNKVEGEINLEALSNTPVVFVMGPRQVGKTTLVKHESPTDRLIERVNVRNPALLPAVPSGVESCRVKR